MEDLGLLDESHHPLDVDAKICHRARVKGISEVEILLGPFLWWDNEVTLFLVQQCTNQKPFVRHDIVTRLENIQISTCLNDIVV